MLPTGGGRGNVNSCVFSTSVLSLISITLQAVTSTQLS